MKLYCLLAAAFAAVNVCAEVIPLENLKPNGHVKNQAVRDGEFSAEVTGHDPYLVVANFPKGEADNIRVLKFEMKAGEGQGKIGQIFWTTTEAPGFHEKNHINFRIPAFGEWVSYEIDLGAHGGWKGTITGLRLDPLVHQSNNNFALRNLEMVPLTVKLFSMHDWAINGHMKDRKIQEGVLAAELLPQKNDPFITGPPMKLPADRLRFIKFDMALPAGVGTTAQLFFTTADMKNFAGDTRLDFKVTADGEFHSYVLDMGKNAKWQGEITRLRLDPTVSAGNGGIMQLKNIRVESEN